MTQGIGLELPSTKFVARQALHDFLGGDGKLGNSNSGSMVDRVGYCRSNDADTGLADEPRGRYGKYPCSRQKLSAPG